MKATLLHSCNTQIKKKEIKKKILFRKKILCVIMLENLDRMLMHLLREREGDDAVISDAQLSTLHEENKLILPKQTVRTQKGGGGQMSVNFS